jgi:hypothetical protein
VFPPDNPAQDSNFLLFSRYMGKHTHTHTHKHTHTIIGPRGPCYLMIAWRRALFGAFSAIKVIHCMNSAKSSSCISSSARGPLHVFNLCVYVCVTPLFIQQVPVAVCVCIQVYDCVCVCVYIYAYVCIYIYIYDPGMLL